MIPQSVAEAVAYKAAAERLTELLLEYGTHKSACSSIVNGRDCDCGWAEIRGRWKA